MLPSIIITKNQRPSLPIDPEHMPQLAVWPPVQLGLFWETLGYAHLTAINHPRPVYYDIWLEAMPGGRFRVRKASGIVGRTSDIRKWNFDRLADATKYFTVKIRQKTNLERKSPRKYRIDIEPASSCGYRARVEKARGEIFGRSFGWCR